MSTAKAVTGDPIAQFEAAVNLKMQQNKLTRQGAVRAVVHEQPELHVAYIDAYNKLKRAENPRA